MASLLQLMHLGNRKVEENNTEVGDCVVGRGCVCLSVLMVRNRFKQEIENISVINIINNNNKIKSRIII